MPDVTSVTPIIPKTEATDKKPDWLLNNLQGFVPGKLQDMHAEGLYANAFSIANPEDYWGKSTIRKAFTDDKGNERKDEFDKYYRQQLSAYKTHRDTELNLVNYASQYPNITAERSKAHTPTPLVFTTEEDSQGRDYQSGYAFTDPFGVGKHSLKEAGINTGVRNPDGTYTATKDFKGPAKFAMGEKGGLLFNEDGRPYLVPVKDGEQLHSWDLVYNKTSEALGAYGYDYSLKHVAASIAKNPLNFASQSIDDLLEYGRGFMNFWGLDSAEGNKSLNRVENWAKGLRVPTTEKNEGSFYNFENIIDTSQQVLYQLGAMYAVGATVGALTKSPKAGSIAAKLFMTALSAGQMAEIARDNGLSKRESALLMGITSAAYYPLMGLSEAAMAKLATKESTAALTDTVRKATENGVKISAIAKNPTKASIRSLYHDLKDGFRSVVFKAENTTPLAVGAVTEGIEEAAEQAVDLMVRGGYNAYSYSADEAKHPFPIDFSNEMAAMGQAATGGAIGGTAAHTIFTKLFKNHPETAQQMHDMVMDGKEETLRNFVARMHKQGRLDNDWMTRDGKITDPAKGDSKNDESKNVLDGLVNYLVELRDHSGIKNMQKNNEQAAKGVFSAVVAASSVGKDASDLSTRIVKLNSDIEAAKAQTTPPPNADALSKMEDELKINQDALAKIVRGDFVADYVTEGLYNTLRLTSQSQALDPSILSGKEFNALVNNVPDQHKKELEVFKQVQTAREEADNRATPENPEGASQEKINEFLVPAKEDYNAKYEALSEHNDVLSNASELGFMYGRISPTTDQKLRNKELDTLKNNVLPSLTTQTQEAEAEEARNLNPKPLAQTLQEIENQRKIELQKAERPSIDLSFINDKKALNMEIEDTITDGKDVQTRKISIKQKQEIIKRKAKKLQELVDCIYG